MKLHLQELRRALHWDDIQWRSLVWLVAGLSVLALWLVLWVGQAIARHRQPVQVLPEEQPVAVAVPRPAAHSLQLGMLTHEVPVLDLRVAEDSKATAHAAEFRGADFVRTQASSWTIQLMTVSEEGVIRGFLANRTDRGQFYYFRTLQGGTERFVLVYGIFNTVQTAMGALQTQSFGLPGSIRPMPVRFSSFEGLVAPDQASNVRVTGVGQGVRQVQLRGVPLPADNPLDYPLSRTRPASPGAGAAPAVSDDALGNLADALDGNGRSSRRDTVQDGFDDAPEAPPVENDAALPSALPSASDPFAGSGN